eukprot:TRINITY_DN29025_c0_g1_i2.p1 TRINITY_DN29025_c0_g1~~TRINITY_DN29025_c0_g1_i2.p1  ORF type:complete len:192 (+),score=49.44 TRINITY_DN29025_c0_g1_i2:266-841(+)
MVAHGQVYRLVTAPIVNSSLISVVFTCVTIVQVGSHMERALGTAHLMLFTLAMLVVSSLIFTAVVLFVGTAMMPQILMTCSVGMWPCLISFMIIQAATSGEEQHRLLCLPVNVPTRWYPVALVALLSLFFGFQLDLIMMAAIAHHYAKGNLLMLTPKAVSYTHLRAHETPEHLVCRLLLEKKKKTDALTPP